MAPPITPTSSSTTAPAQTATSNLRSQYLLLVGAITGLVLAASGLLAPNPPVEPAAVATVNGQNISKEDYLTYLTLLAKDKRNPLTKNDHRHVLNRMIEEKLLIERGVDIGLADSDPKVRKAITAAMIETVIADIASTEPSAEQLADFYQQHQDYFSQPARLQVQRIIFRAASKQEALKQAQAAKLRLQQGQDFLEIKKTLGSQDILNIPNVLLPPNKLRQYIGPQLTAVALSMNNGEISEPIQDGNGYSLLYLISIEKKQPQPLQDIREQVANEYTRRAGDKALQDYLQQLRQQADVSIDNVFLSSLENINTTPAVPE